MIIRFHDIVEGIDIKDIDCPIEEVADYLKVLKGIDTVELNSNYVLESILLLPIDDLIMVFLSH